MIHFVAQNSYQLNYLFLQSYRAYAHFLEQLNEPDLTKRQRNEKRIAYQMRRMAERYARKEKASKAGYHTSDESFYETTTIAQLLPFVIQSVLHGTVLRDLSSINILCSSDTQSQVSNSSLFSRSL